MLLCYMTLIEDGPKQTLFESIYIRYRKQMLFVANSVLNDPLHAEDAVHNAFLRIARNMHAVQRIENPADLRNYLLKSAKNAALDLLPKVQRPELPLSDVQELSDRDFSDALFRRVAYEEVISAMMDLEPRYRDVLYHHFVLGFSAPETARALNRSADTVKKQLSRGKKQLLEELERRGICHE